MEQSADNQSMNGTIIDPSSICSYAEVVNKRNMTENTKTQLQSTNTMHEVESSANPATPNRPTYSFILGTSKTSHFKASTNLQVKKAIYRLGNVNAEYKESDVIEYLNSLGIRTISCHELPKRCFFPFDNKQFRVCIFAADKMLCSIKTIAMSEGISLKNWVFRVKPNAARPASETNVGHFEQASGFSAVQNSHIIQEADNAVNTSK